MENIYFERTVLSTALFADVFDIDYAAHQELREEWFTDPFHRLVVKYINHAKANGLVDEMIVQDAMARDRVLDQHKFIDIVSANPLGSEQSFLLAIEKIRGVKKSQHEDI